MKALVSASKPEKALEGAISVIVKTDGSFAAQHRTHGRVQWMMQRWNALEYLWINVNIVF